MDDSMPICNTFAEYIRFVGDIFSYILNQNRFLGNTCMEYEKFAKRVYKYACVSQSDLPYFLAFYKDSILCVDGLIGLKSDFEKDALIHKKVLERMNKKSLPDFKLLPNKKLNDCQKDAVHYASHTDISIITGGAGTGKTTIINQILKNFNKTFADEKSVYVLAPTGKAAKRAKETITEPCTICTVHYFVGWGHCLNKRDYQRIKDADFIIIDESSMLSAELFYVLIQMTDAPIVLVGDVNQLPAVDAGNILKDLISLGVPTYALSTNYRSDSDILSNANAFLAETFPGVTSSVNFEVCKVEEADVSSLLVDSGADVILTPFRQEDICGSCTAINRIVHEQKGYTYGIYHAGEPVIMMKSNRKQGYVNGETGYVTAVTLDDIYVDLGDRVVAVKDETELDLNYSTTIHKSQGSEYESIAIYCPDVPMLTRNTIYTAITRAKHKVKLFITDDSVFKRAHSRSAHHRSTFLSVMMAS